MKNVLNQVFKISLFSMLWTTPSFSMGAPKPQPDLRENTRPEVVGAWYHHWWYKGRFNANHKNHPYEPVLGHYIIDKATVTQHATWALDHGINTLMPNFWLTDHDWWWVKAHTDIALDVFDQMGVKYFFLMDHDLSNGGWEKHDPNDVANKVVTRAGQYLNRPNFIRIDNKPVLFFWAAYKTSCTFWNKVRAGIESKLGPVYMTGEIDGGCFDAKMTYNPYTPEKNNMAGQLERQEKFWSGWNKKKTPWVPTALAGYNDTLVRQGNPPIPLDPEGFRKSIQTALKYKQYMSNGESWLMINSFNEWHEGSNIEPNTSFKDPLILLKVLKEELNKLR